ILAQPGASAVRTSSATAITGQQYAILDLVCLGCKIFEKVIQPFEMFIAIPKYVLLFSSQLVVRPMNREIEFDSILQQWFLPFSHRLTAPGSNCTFVNRKRFIRDN